MKMRVQELEGVILDFDHTNMIANSIIKFLKGFNSLIWRAVSLANSSTHVLKRQTLRNLLTKPGWNSLEIRTLRGVLSAFKDRKR